MILVDGMRAGRNCGGTAFAAKHMKTTELDSSSSAGRPVSHDGCCRPLERRRFMRRGGGGESCDAGDAFGGGADEAGDADALSAARERAVPVHAGDSRGL